MSEYYCVCITGREMTHLFSETNQVEDIILFLNLFLIKDKIDSL